MELSYTEIIEEFSIYHWLFNFLVLLAVLWYSKADKEFKSTLVALLVAIVIGGVMTAYSPDLKAFIRANKPPDGDTTLFNIGLFGWYVGFILFYITATIVTWKIHVWYKIEYSYVTYAHLLAYLLLNLLQVMRYAERLTVNEDYLKAFYKYGVLSINTGVSLTAFVVLVGVTVTRYRIKKGKRGLSWSL
jgi:hypothetical protein